MKQQERFPVDDEQKTNPFLEGKEHEDLVFEEDEKFEKKMNDYFERQNEENE